MHDQIKQIKVEEKSGILIKADIAFIHNSISVSYFTFYDPFFENDDFRIIGSLYNLYYSRKLNLYLLLLLNLYAKSLQLRQGFENVNACESSCEKYVLALIYIAILQEVLPQCELNSLDISRDFFPVSFFYFWVRLGYTLSYATLILYDIPTFILRRFFQSKMIFVIESLFSESNITFAMTREEYLAFCKGCIPSLLKRYSALKILFW